MRQRFRSRLIIILSLVHAGTAFAQRQGIGEWGQPFELANVAIHAHLLPSGKVMFWGRREWDPTPGGKPTEDINQTDPDKPHITTPWLLDLTTLKCSPLQKPGFNIFCAGHTFLPDGRLFVAGGHLSDNHGDPHAAIYDPVADQWQRLPDEPAILNGAPGRWYPAVTLLSDGGVLVSFGGNKNGEPNATQRIWKNGKWTNAQEYQQPPYYPRMHLISGGGVLMTGPLGMTKLLNIATGEWLPLRQGANDGDTAQLSSRAGEFRDYAPAVMYDVDKILFVGGGIPPTNTAEVLDLTAQPRQWKATGSMRFPRRQHDATLLADGTVLVTGGTQGSDGESNGFNDLTPGAPIRAAERWDPKTGQWTTLAEAAFDRGYHSVSVLLPDATVLNAGSGEYSPQNNGIANRPEDSHREAQIFSPPYLFATDGSPATRPTISNAPAEVKYNTTFDVDTPDAAEIRQVTLVRLSSVTHSFNANQRINFLTFTPNAGNSQSLKVTSPFAFSVCPAGHYLLFLLSEKNVPSVAKVVRIGP